MLLVKHDVRIALNVPDEAHVADCLRVGIKTRERIVLSANGVMQQSIRVIEGSKSRFDRSLLAWVTLGRITFDTAIQLEDGNGENQDSVFASYEERLRQWTAECSPDIVDGQFHTFARSNQVR